MCVALWLVAPAAHGQQAEQITVTPDTMAAGPGGAVRVDAAELARSGLSTVGGLLDQLPAFGAQGVNGAQNDGGYGEYFVDLRDLNFNRTLVLVNGQRFVLSGIKTDEAVDLNGIPAAFVDHVEVLRDGGSPRYAADAVAGAVNVVLKDQIEGARAEAYGGAAAAGDAGTAEASLIAGHVFPNGHVVAGLDLYRRDPEWQSDRSWAADPIATALRAPAGPVVTFGSQATPGGHVVGPGIDEVALGNGAFRPFDAARDAYDDAASRTLQGGLRRATGYLNGEYSLTDGINAALQLLYTDRSAANSLPPQILGLDGTARHPDGLVIPASNRFNPFGVPVTLERVVSEAGAQATTTSGPVWRALAQLDGVWRGWNWSAAFNHGQSLSRYTTSGAIDLTRALQTVGEGACPAAAGCVAADWFGPGSLSPQALAYLAYRSVGQSSYAETVGTAQLAGGLATLPAGTVRLTAGVEVRDEQGKTQVDPVTARGDQAEADAAPTQGGYGTTELFANLAVPLLRDLPGASRLDLTLAGRETVTSRYGTFATGRAALDYLPVQGIHVRAVAATSRRPPAIAEAFGGITALAQPVADPCAPGAARRGNPVVDANCRAQGLGPGFVQTSPTVDVLSGGNPDLHPENATNLLLGVSLDPPALPFLSAQLDYYHYHVGDAIDSLEDTDPNFVPQACYASMHLQSPFCSLIRRIPGGGNKRQISSILGLDENVGVIRTDGLEFGLDMSSPSAAWGQLRLNWQTNWLLNYELHTTGQDGLVQYAGTLPGLSAVGSYARVRSRATLDYTCGPWSLGWTGRFISGARVLESPPDSLYDRAPDIFYQDVSASRGFGRLTVMAGVDNLTDQKPPTLVDGETNTNVNTYDVVGRFVWGRVNYVF